MPSIQETKEAIQKARKAILEKIPEIFNETIANQIKNEINTDGLYTLKPEDIPALKNLKAFLNILNLLESLVGANQKEAMPLLISLAGQAKHFDVELTLSVNSEQNALIQNIYGIIKNFNPAEFKADKLMSVLNETVGAIETIKDPRKTTDAFIKHLDNLIPTLEKSLAQIYKNPDVLKKSLKELAEDKYKIEPNKDPLLVEKTKILINTIRQLKFIAKDVEVFRGNRVGALGMAVHGLALKKRIKKVMENLKQLSVDEVMLKEWGPEVSLNLKNIISDLDRSTQNMALAAKAMEEKWGLQENLLQNAITFAFEKIQNDAIQVKQANNIFRYDDPAFIASGLIDRRLKELREKTEKISKSTMEKSFVLIKLEKELNLAENQTPDARQKVLDKYKSDKNMQSEGQKKLLSDIESAINNIKKAQVNFTERIEKANKEKLEVKPQPVVFSTNSLTAGIKLGEIISDMDKTRNEIKSTQELIAKELPNILKNNNILSLGEKNGENQLYDIQENESQEIKNIKSTLNLLTLLEKINPNMTVSELQELHSAIQKQLRNLNNDTVNKLLDTDQIQSTIISKALEKSLGIVNPAIIKNISDTLDTLSAINNNALMTGVIEKIKNKTPSLDSDKIPPELVSRASESQAKIKEIRINIEKNLGKIFDEKALSLFNKSAGLYNIDAKESSEITSIKSLLNILMTLEEIKPNMSDVEQIKLLSTLLKQGEHFQKSGIKPKLDKDYNSNTILSASQLEVLSQFVSGFTTSGAEKLPNLVDLFNNTVELLSDPTKSTELMVSQIERLSNALTTSVINLYPNKENQPKTDKKEAKNEPLLIKQTVALLNALNNLKEIIKEVEALRKNGVGISDAYTLYKIKGKLDKIRENLSSLSLENILIKEWGPKIAMHVKKEASKFHDAGFTNALVTAQSLEDKLGLKENSIQDTIGSLFSELRTQAERAHIKIDAPDIQEEKSMARKELLNDLEDKKEKLEKSLEDLEAKIKQFKSSPSVDEKELAVMLKEQEQLKTSLVRLNNQIEAIEERLKNLAANDSTFKESKPANQSQFAESKLFDLMRYDDATFLMQHIIDNRLDSLNNQEKVAKEAKAQALVNYQNDLKDIKLGMEKKAGQKLDTKFIDPRKIIFREINSAMELNDVLNDKKFASQQPKIALLEGFKKALANPENQNPAALRKLLDLYKKHPLLKDDTSDKQIFVDIEDALKNLNKVKIEAAKPKKEEPMLVVTQEQEQKVQLKK